MGGGPNAGFRSVAYFVNWAIYARKHRPQDLPVENLTHVLYAFANINAGDGTVSLTDAWADVEIHFDGDSWNDPPGNLYGCLKQLNLLKKRNRNLKVLLSVGGWTYSSNFKTPASSNVGRERFVETCVDLVRHLGFDGIDIDWEYPQNPDEATNFVTILQLLRRQLDSYSASLPHPHHFEITVACPAGPQNYQKLNIQEMDKVLDFWNLMAYDYAGSWDGRAGHQANLHHCHENPVVTPFNTAAALDYYIEQGVAPDKIVLGMPLYGRAFENTEGPGHQYQGVGDGTWERGVYDYKVLPINGAQEFEDERVGASYSYDPNKKTLVSYDTVPMARLKAAFIKQRGLGGAMWWESSADKAGNDSLIQTVIDGLGGTVALMEQQNCVSYPESKYNNLREGFPDEP